MSQGKDTEFETRKKIYEDVKQFSRTEQEELYRILRRCNEEMSENRNGIFFDMMTLREETMGRIQEWIEFCKKNRDSFESREKQMTTLAEEIHTDDA
jgi:phage host-nuclease inhibitor protein Gam